MYMPFARSRPTNEACNHEHGNQHAVAPPTPRGRADALHGHEAHGAADLQARVKELGEHLARELHGELHSRMHSKISTRASKYVLYHGGDQGTRPFCVYYNGCHPDCYVPDSVPAHVLATTGQFISSVLVYVGAGMCTYAVIKAEVIRVCRALEAHDAYVVTHVSRSPMWDGYRRMRIHICGRATLPSLWSLCARVCAAHLDPYACFMALPEDVAMRLLDVRWKDAASSSSSPPQQRHHHHSAKLPHTSST